MLSKHMSFARRESPRTLTLPRRVSMNIYSSDKAVPYVYICTHKETNQFYIGYRMRNVKLNKPSHLDLPKYKTSSTTIRPDFSNYNWTIVAEFFDSSHAYTFEQQLICDNWENPLLLNEHYNLGENHFRNKGGKPSKRKGILTGPNGKKGIPSGRKGEPSEKKGKLAGKQRNPSGLAPWNKGISTGPHSAESNQQRSDTLTGTTQPKVECPHCGKIGGAGPMKRWHFDNCKKKL